MKDRIGFLWVSIWQSESIGVELGIKTSHCLLSGNYGAFSARTKRFLFFYITISRPTLGFVHRKN